MSGVPKKKQNWPSLLAEFEQIQRPFVWGEWDCWLMSCAWVTLATGRQFKWPKYKTLRGALGALKKEGCKDVEAAANKYFGPSVGNGNYAQRGDLVLLHTNDGPSMGVLTTNSKVLAVDQHEGSWRLLRYHAKKCWRIA